MLGEKVGADYTKHIGRLSSLYSEALQIGARLPIGKSIEDPDANFLTFLQYFVGRVGSMRPGESLLFPGGWRCETKEGHALMYLLHRHHASFAFGVSNTGGEGNGLEFHPARTECSPPKIKRALSLVAEDIPPAKLLDSSFWFMLFRPLVYPSDKNGPEALYTILLPYLNHRTASANAYKYENFLTGPEEKTSAAPTELPGQLPTGVDDTPDELWGMSTSDTTSENNSGGLDNASFGTQAQNAPLPAFGGMHGNE